MIHIFLCDGKYPKHRRVLSCCRSPLSELSEVCNAYSSESHLFFSLASRLKSRSPSYLIRKKRGEKILEKTKKQGMNKNQASGFKENQGLMGLWGLTAIASLSGDKCTK